MPVGSLQTPPTAEGGALRSQSPRRAAGEPRVLNGSLLRVDPATGEAAPGNPFSGSSDANERRIVGYGLRNPFRMIVKPGTNEVWIADVGWGNWEEINRIPDAAAALNFGWPCFEGPGPRYNGFTVCPSPADVTAPFFQYHHEAEGVPGDGCPTGSSSIAGMAFYGGGSNYPPAYGGAFFFSDYSRSCLWVMFPGEGGDPDPAAATPFASSALGAVDLQIGPDGNLYYVDFDGGRILRVVYGLRAVASANPTSGLVPLTVQFDSTGTQPAQPGDVLAYFWDFDGDGEFDDSTEPQPSHTYPTAGTFPARLGVADNHGGFHVSDPVVIRPGNQAPTATILTPSSSLTWKVGDPITFFGEGTDPQDGALAAKDLSWSVVIHHCPSNCHTHVYQTFPGVAGGSFAAPDHEFPAYLEIRLTATDSGGLTGTSSINLNPQTVNLTLASSPPGLQLSAGTETGVAPFTRAFIVGSQTGLAAASPQGAFPSVWEFGAWSDGGAQSHTITAPAAPATYVASFSTRADLSLTMADAPDPACEAQPITYTLDVANAGPSQAVSVSVVHTLPAGSTLVGAGGAGWTCSGSSVVVCTAPALGLGAAPPVTVVAAAPVGSPSASSSATVGSVTTDTSGANNSADVSTKILVSPAQPAIVAPETATVGATGLKASVADHAGASYAWTLDGGSITAGQGSSAITFDAGPPGTRMTLEVVETSGGCPSTAASARIAVDFLDVPPAHPLHDFVSAIARSGVTAGCGSGNFCPESPNTRAQMAVFLLKARYGEDHAPPPASGTVFLDVSAGDPFAPWIEELAALGVTAGCGGGNYCPGAAVTRSQMALFLLKTFLGSSVCAPGRGADVRGRPAGKLRLRLDQRPRQPGHHGRLRRRKLLPGLSQHARTDGCVHRQDVCALGRPRSPKPDPTDRFFGLTRRSGSGDTLSSITTSSRGEPTRGLCHWFILQQTAGAGRWCPSSQVLRWRAPPRGRATSSRDSPSRSS